MPKLNYAETGARIRQLRKAKGWSQEELAKKCGISLNFVGQIERGTRSMSLDTFASLCRELETNADTLLWGIQKKHNNEMYVRIMRSVANILEDMPDREKKEKMENGGTKNAKYSACNKQDYEDYTII